MGKKKKILQALKRVEFGSSTAENDKSLVSYYVENEYYRSVRHFESPLSFFIGRKGVGKSALLQMVRLQQNPEVIIELTCDDFALEVISSSHVVDALSQTGSNHELLYQIIWKYMILLRILRRVDPQLTWWKSLLNRFIGRRSPITDFLTRADKIGSATPRFGENVLGLLEHIAPKISYGLAGASTSIEFGQKPRKIESAEAKAISQLELFKDINTIIKDIDEFLGGKKIYVLIDDLDMNWRNEYNQNSFIRSLFKAILKLMHSKYLRFMVSLRQDIFLQLELEDMDKYSEHIETMVWTRSQLEQILMKRISVCYKIAENQIQRKLFSENVGRQRPLIYLAKKSMTPRDILQFGHACIKTAAQNDIFKISEKIILKAENEFSRRKLSNLSTEFKPVYPGLMRLFQAFHGAPKEFSLIHLEENLINFMSGASNTETSWILGYQDNIHSLIGILLKIGFLGYKKTRKDRADYIMLDDIPPVLGDKFWFAIHPCYERALALH